MLPRPHQSTLGEVSAVNPAPGDVLGLALPLSHSLGLAMVPCAWYHLEGATHQCEMDSASQSPAVPRLRMFIRRLKPSPPVSLCPFLRNGFPPLAHVRFCKALTSPISLPYLKSGFLPCLHRYVSGLKRRLNRFWSKSFWVRFVFSLFGLFDFSFPNHPLSYSCQFFFQNCKSYCAIF